MRYDTEHVWNAGENPGMITNIPAFSELLTNPDLASLYTSIRRSADTTAPDLIETAAVSKKTVYEYLDKLEQAGLIINSGEQSGTTVYEAADFELMLTVREVEVSITPELVKGVAHAEEYPVIKRVLDDHGLVPFALTHDLVKAHSNGDVTIRQIGTLTGVSSGTAYDLIEALYAIHDLGPEDSSPETSTPEDIPADNNAMGEMMPDE